MHPLRSSAARAALLALIAALAPASGCTPEREPVTHTVVMEGMKFQPESLAVRAGDTVVWVNKDLFPHTATSRHGAFDSGAIAAGASWTKALETTGAFEYVCAYHPTMKARLTVE